MTRRTILKAGVAGLSSTLFPFASGSANYQPSGSVIDLIFHGMFAFVVTKGSLMVYTPRVRPHWYGVGFRGREQPTAPGRILATPIGIGAASFTPPDPKVYPTLVRVPKIDPGNKLLYSWCQLPLPDGVKGYRRAAVHVHGSDLKDEMNECQLVTRFWYNATAGSSLTLQGSKFNCGDKIHFRAEPPCPKSTGAVAKHLGNEHLLAAIGDLASMLGLSASDISADVSIGASVERSTDADGLSKEDFMSLDEMCARGTVHIYGSQVAHCFSVFASE